MKNLVYLLLITIAITSLTLSCTNTNQTSDATNVQVDNKTTLPTESPATPITKPIAGQEDKTSTAQKEIVEKIAPVQKEPDKQVNEQAAKKQQEDKLAQEQAAKEEEEEAKRAKAQADKLAQEQATQKAKEQADKLAQEQATQKAKEQADKLAQEQAAKKAKEQADKLVQEEAAKKAKEQADKLVQEEAAKKAKEQADKLAQEQAAKKAKEQTPKQTKEKAETIIKKVDKNMRAETQISTTEMVIHGKRNSRTIRSKGYTMGDKKSFSEYLSPAKEKGTKMLKLDDRLWIYSPDTDRSIQLSGHMLKQSIMGSDLSYEDMMEDRKLTEVYDAKVIGEESIDQRLTWVLELNAKVDDASYENRKMWIDQQRYVPLKEELYAKSGKLLKKITMNEITKIDGRWFPKKMNFKDMLKTGKGTDFIIIDIQFNPKIPEHIFSKASLKK